ncbi:MAG: hypothetical protein WEE89_18210 [Gemmatimonadota bacterium]
MQHLQILLLAIGFLLSGNTGSLAAQNGPHGSDWTAPAWVGDVTFLGANALTSGLSAGILQRLRGGSFKDGLARGAIGGSVKYAGMRISAKRFDGAGLLGRQVAATGTSMVRNASDARPTFDRLLFPLGPLHLYVQLSDGIAVRPKIDLTAFVTLISAAVQTELSWDAGASFSAGAPVFRATDRYLISGGRAVDGFMGSGSIFLSHLPSADFLAHVFAHERVHVLQSDWLFQVWSDPAESWILNRIPGGSTFYRYFDFNMLAKQSRTRFYQTFRVGYENRLHEIEAEFLGNR